MKKALIILLASLQIAQAMPAHAESDQFGVPYPAACSVEATNAEKAKHPLPRLVPQKVIDAATKAKGRVGTVTPTGFVLILKTLKGEKYEDVYRHEMCHFLVGEFHPSHPE